MIEKVMSLMRDVGQSLLAWREAGGTEGVWDAEQFHAKADQWAHQRLCAGLVDIQRNIPIVSEEDESSDRGIDSERYWIVDPIDGTASYIGGFGGFVTQAALIENGVPKLAVVFAPACGDLFVAERGHGAFKNGSRLPAGKTASLTLIDNYSEPRGITSDLYRDFAFSRYVESGSIGLKICRVAEGSADVFFKAVLVRDWDLAAPHLILQESGGYLFAGMGSEIKYGAPRRHLGLIATREIELAQRIVSWHEGRIAQSGVAL